MLRPALILHTAFPGTDAYTTYGASTDLWGTSDATPANINSSNFGVGFTAQFQDNGCESSPCSIGARVDHIRIAVYYTNASDVQTTLMDHLGGTNVVTNASGTIVQTIDYYPYGAIRINSNSGSDQRRKFTGHEYDTGTGLTYANARYLNTDIGRFISQDQAFLLIGSPNFEERYNRTLQEFLADPQLLNSYSYARNNPVKFVDEDGENVALAAIIVGLINLANALSNYIASLGGVGMTALQINQAAQTFNNSQSSVFQKGTEIFGLLPFGGVAGSVDDVGKQGLKAAEEILPDSAYFCRGGKCDTVGDWIKANGEPLKDGKLTNVSVNSSAGRSPEELLKDIPTNSGFPYGEGRAGLVGEVRRLGGNVTPTPGYPGHSTLSGITPQQAVDLVQKVFNQDYWQGY